MKMFCQPSFDTAGEESGCVRLSPRLPPETGRSVGRKFRRGQPERGSNHRIGERQRMERSEVAKLLGQSNSVGVYSRGSACGSMLRSCPGPEKTKYAHFKQFRRTG
ncbi:unnamed protein product [Protopolystoma xenopodis]|uniref:Uncharacterized protein n=1 Tax=Protopolystoma xenopodis TaxID=117903 RepID=A0A448XNI4_9PLAT|nr:unnamed protein product [Protopolystoma xenopodis]